MLIEKDMGLVLYILRHPTWECPGAGGFQLAYPHEQGGHYLLKPSGLAFQVALIKMALILA